MSQDGRIGVRPAASPARALPKPRAIAFPNPLASGAIYLAIFLAILAAHASLLRLPYYWDEAGYFIPAALDLLRHGWWIPRTTLANGHPPLVMAALALGWKLLGARRWVARGSMALFAAALLWGEYRAGEDGGGVRAGVIAAGLLAATPLFFAQSTLAMLDLPAAAWLIWALIWRRRGRTWAYVACATAAVLSKETALIAPAAWFLGDAVHYRIWRARGAGHSRRKEFARLAAHVVPALALGAWLSYYHHATGYWMGNATFLRFNVGGTLEGTLAPARFLLALWLRVWQLAGYEGMIGVTVLAAWAWARARRAAGGGTQRMDAAAESGIACGNSAWRRDLLLLITAYVGLHALIGGAVLARYLLPAIAAYLLLVGPALARLPRAGVWLGLAAALLVAHWWWRPPYPFPYEDNLSYATFVRLQEQGIAALEHDGAKVVATAWPATNELTDPDLGYVAQPPRVIALEDFTASSLAAAPLGRKPGQVSAAGSGRRYYFLYSRQYQPARDWSRALPFWRRWKRRFFDAAAAPPRPEQLRLLRASGLFFAAAGGQWVEIAAPEAAASKNGTRRPARRNPG